jgi:hypothetical protein
MSQPGPVVDARLQHLLAVVERNRAQRCQAVIEAAEQQARQIVSQSYSTARARTHADFGALREHIRQRLASAEAQQQTRLRQLRQQADRAFLLAAWQPLRQALQRNWQDTGHREQWVRQLVDTAASMLMDAHWLIEHPGDWPEHERDALMELLDRTYRCVPRLAADPDISAGLRICAAGACVDGTIDGLLARRARIEALLLAEIRTQPAAPGQTPGPVMR